MAWPVGVHRQQGSYVTVGFDAADDRVPEVRPRLAGEEARGGHDDALRQGVRVHQRVQHGEGALERQLADRRRPAARPRRQRALREALHSTAA